MKAEDLMIGDWVIRRGVPEEPMRLYDMKVSAGIVYLDQDGRGVTEKFENIEPIQLTEEILKKNSFLEDSNGIFYLKENLKFGIKKILITVIGLLIELIIIKNIFVYVILFMNYNIY